MYFICYDFETTGRNSNWDQIIQVAAVLANENLEEMDSFESSCFLKPGTIPEPGALMVNERIPGEETNLSHYELVKLMRRKFTDWVNTYSPVAFIGYNSVNFDEEFLRRTLYKNLFPPFLTTAHTFGVAGKRGDIINLARTANNFFPGTFKTTFNEKGREVYKLDQLARDNLVSGTGKKFKFHDALDDVKATIEIAKIIKKKTPQLWNSALRTMTKNDVIEFINQEEFVLSSEFNFGESRIYIVALICDNSKGTLKLFDLRNDPSQLIGLDYQELKKIINQTSPKIIRSIRMNAHPILMTREFIYSVVGYENIGIEELNRRTQVLKENKELSSQLKRLIFEEVEANEEKRAFDQADKEPEESIYSFGFASPQEKNLMAKFHASDWQEKLKIAYQFQNLRSNDHQSLQRGRIYSDFAKLIVFEENPGILSEVDRNQIKKKLADRMFFHDTDTVKSPWNNIERAHLNIVDIAAELSEKGEQKKIDFLCKIKDLIEDIEHQFLNLKS